MTCIVGLAANGRVWIGGDSAGVSGLDLAVRADSKVFHNGPMVMGFTSSFRMGQLLRWALKVPDHPSNMDIEQYMATTFANAVRCCLKEGGYAGKKEDREEGGTFLVGYGGRLFQINADYQIGEASCGYDAVGSGFAYALGSMGETARCQPKERIRRALMSAERNSAGVIGPMRIIDGGAALAAREPLLMAAE